MKRRNCGLWSIKMVLIPFINVVYGLICLENLFIYSKVINENIYCHAKCKVSSFLIRILCEILYIAPTTKI